MSGTTSFTSVPIVDISGLGSPDRQERERVAAELGKAASEVGFFYVGGAGVDDLLFDRMLAATKEFFALPLDEKMRYYIGLSACHRGYVPSGEEGLATGMPEMKEAFDTALDLPADDPDYLAGNPMLGPNTWPDLPGFADAVTAYYEAVLDVGQRLLRAFAVALGEDPDTFSKHATKTPSQLRLIHYPYNPDAVDGEGIGAHTDYECFTLLKPTAPGLEVLNGAAIGSAAAVKMCRSIIVKGLEALMCECVLAAGRYDADEYVFQSLNESFPGLDWKKLADYMVGRVVVHGERRAREMEEVAETLRAIDIEPIMTEAAVRRQDWSAGQRLKEQFGPDGPRTYREVLDALRAHA